MAQLQTMISFLAHYYGILPGYWDIWGTHHETSIETKAAILNAMGVDASDELKVRTEIEEVFSKLQWEIPPVVSLDEGDPLVIHFNCFEKLIPYQLEWSLFKEDGTFVGEGRFRLDDLKISVHPLLKVWQDLAGNSSSFGWDALKECSFTLPLVLSPGYYKLFLQASNQKFPQEVLVIVAPSQASVCNAHGSSFSRAGLAVQLYAVRSGKNWGIGNFRDLQEIVDIAQSLGAGFVGLNPFHLLFPENSHHISPYSPSSRRFLNPWYVSVEDVEEFKEARASIPADVWDQVSRCRELLRIDYNTVVPSLYRAFQALYDVFRNRHLACKTSRAMAFEAFCAEQGDALKQYGIFESLRERFQSPWWEWHISDEIISNVEERADFFRYLQFIAHEQLISIRNKAYAGYPPVRLYLDLSVSVDAGGFDVWFDRDVYTLGARIGAPPDDFNPRGQEWGVVPMVPHKLKEARYKPLIETLRSVMRYADILRIDHVMGFFRLFWIPDGFLASQGAYVRYPMEDIARLVALESARNDCTVIGEDLGTVPDEVREEMRRRGFLSYRVFYFERRHDGSFKSPEEYPEKAIAVVTTHDLPTFVGYWTERDIDARANLGMIDQTFENKLREERMNDRHRILDALFAEGLECPEHQEEFHSSVKPPSRELVIAVHRYLLRSNAQFVAFQLDDLIGQEDQPNLPGTTIQYPCWRIRLRKSLEEIRQKVGELREFFVEGV
ncbi:MAG: 4-alpha-glucanotransferase [Thermodesulforhabdaceae bacterium]